MKRLYLARHSKAIKSDGTVRDFDRELNSRGIRDGEFMAKKLVEEFGKVGYILCSPSARTSSTALFFAETSNIPANQIHKDKSIYASGPENLLQVIQELPDEENNVLMVGHNPGFSLIASFLSGEEVELPTSAFAVLDLDVTSWRETKRACAILVSFDFPSKYFNE